MYAHINGIVEDIASDRAVIEAGGIGYELICSGNTLKRLQIGKAAKVFTHFQVSQDAAALYGFYSGEEREMFRKMIGISRIGPKAALSVLSALTPEDVALAVLTDNTAAFDCVRGMGRKTAERLILELKGKVDAPEIVAASGSAELNDSSAGMRAEAVAALVALGYDGRAAGRAAAAVPECDRVEDMIRAALRELSK